MNHTYNGFNLQPFNEDEEGYITCSLILNNETVCDFIVHEKDNKYIALMNAVYMYENNLYFRDEQLRKSYFD
jgi:hypothetical protein